jgi:hypothetical protein
MTTRDRVWQRDGGICIYCEDAVGQVLEHVIPRSRGGPTTLENLVLACYSCNTRKAQPRHLEAMVAQGLRYLAGCASRRGDAAEQGDDTPAPVQHPFGRRLLPKLKSGPAMLGLRGKYAFVRCSQRRNYRRTGAR